MREALIAFDGGRVRVARQAAATVTVTGRKVRVAGSRRAYSPDQERDAGGRFGQGSGSGSGKYERAVEAVRMAPSVKRGFEPDFQSEHFGYPQAGPADGYTVTEQAEGKNQPASTDIGGYDGDGNLVSTFSIATSGDAEGAFKVSVRDDAQRQGYGVKILAEAERQGFDLAEFADRNRYTAEGRALATAYFERRARQAGARRAYSPDQSRDSSGRFGEGSGVEDAVQADTAAAGAELAAIGAVHDDWGTVHGAWGSTTLDARELVARQEAAVAALDRAGLDGLAVNTAVVGWSEAWGVDQWRAVAGSDRAIAVGESRSDRVPTDPEERAAIEGALEVARNTEIPEPLYRSISLGSYEGQLSRDDLIPGAVIDNRGISSWSRSEDVAGVFGVRGVQVDYERATLEVTGAHGLDVAALVDTAFAWQREVMVVDPVFRVVSVDGDRVTVEPVAAGAVAAALSGDELADAVFGETFGEATIRLGHEASPRSAAAMRAYSPDQSRDSSGRFGEGSGSSVADPAEVAAELAAQAATFDFGKPDGERGGWVENEIHQEGVKAHEAAAQEAEAILDRAGYDGEAIHEAVTWWSDGTGVSLFRGVALGREHPINPGGVPIDAVQETLDLARTAEIDAPIYRGLMLSEATVKGLEPGVTLDGVGVASWTRDPDVARVFSGYDSGDTDDPVPVELTISAGARGLDIAALGSPDYAWQSEVLVPASEYRVVSVGRTYDGDGYDVEVEPVYARAAAAGEPPELGWVLFGETFAQASIRAGHPPRQAAAARRAYSEDQERDDDGRWGSGGGSSREKGTERDPTDPKDPTRDGKTPGSLTKHGMVVANGQVVKAGDRVLVKVPYQGGQRNVLGKVREVDGKGQAIEVKAEGKRFLADPADVVPKPTDGGSDEWFNDFLTVADEQGMGTKDFAVGFIIDRGKQLESDTALMDAWFGKQASLLASLVRTARGGDRKPARDGAGRFARHPGAKASAAGGTGARPATTTIAGYDAYRVGRMRVLIPKGLGNAKVHGQGWHATTPRRELLRAASRLARRFPDRKATFRVSKNDAGFQRKGGLPTSYGYMIHSKSGVSVLTLHPSLMDPTTNTTFASKAGAGFFAPVATTTNVVEYVATHEFGHSLAPVEKPASPWTPADGATAAVARAEAASGSRVLSGYGRTDPVEAFADGFLDHFLAPGTDPFAEALAKDQGWR